ncbi:DinB family protein [Citricoccus sp. GCM10030269]|uniref:mycothiol transferase n=1 Tax=Citricoccus sp. GCM10030269 TaxID=3273388 RepID=UPI0036182C7E
MNGIAVLQDLAHRPLDQLDLLWDRVEVSQLNRHPGGHPNSIAWLLWHSAREIDAQVADLAGREQIWTAQGWQERFDLDVSAGDHGFGHTEDQARSVVVEDKDLLRGYLDAVTAESTDYLGTLDESDLGEVIDTQWDPPVTRGARLVSVYADALQHIGQAAYITGMSDA